MAHSQLVKMSKQRDTQMSLNPVKSVRASEHFGLRCGFQEGRQSAYARRARPPCTCTYAQACTHTYPLVKDGDSAVCSQSPQQARGPHAGASTRASNQQQGGTSRAWSQVFGHHTTCRSITKQQWAAVTSWKAFGPSSIQRTCQSMSAI